MFAAVGSCLGSALAFLACGCCKCVSGEVLKRSARAGYCALFAFAMLLAWVMKDFARPLVDKIPGVNIKESTDDVWYGEQAVYRLSFGNVLFFGGLSLLLIGVKYKSDKRDEYVHHGSWAVKGLLWIGFLLVSFFIPGHLYWYGWVARVGSGVFLVVQMLILLDFTHTLNDAWFAKGEENSKFMYALLATTIALFLGTLGLFGMGLFLFKTSGNACSMNVSLLTVALLLVVTFSVLSVHPASPHGSLFPSGVIGLYCMYLCFSALQSEPRSYECNKLGSSVVSGTSIAIGMLVTLAAVIYSALRAGSNTGTFFMTRSDDEEELNEQPLLKTAEEGASAGLDGETSAPAAQTTTRRTEAMEEYQPVTYNYSFFHMIFALASMYVAMLMSGWGTDADEKLMDVSWTSVYVKFGSMVVTGGLYTWTLVAPMMFPDRDFS